MGVVLVCKLPSLLTCTTINGFMARWVRVGEGGNGGAVSGAIWGIMDGGSIDVEGCGFVELCWLSTACVSGKHGAIDCASLCLPEEGCSAHVCWRFCAALCGVVFSALFGGPRFLADHAAWLVGCSHQHERGSARGSSNARWLPMAA
eukprot:364207-Chlamydomonas_euryale.AAC.8